MYIRKKMTGDEKKDFKKLFSVCKEMINKGYQPMSMDVLIYPKRQEMEIEFERIGKPAILKSLIADASFANADRLWIYKQEFTKDDNKKKGVSK